MKDQADVKKARQFFIRSLPCQHVEKVGGVAQFRQRGEGCPVAANLLPCCQDCRQFGHESDGVFQFPLPGWVRYVRIVVGQHGYAGLKDVHGEGLFGSGFQGVDDLIRDGDISANVDMQPGDIVIIPEAWF